MGDRRQIKHNALIRAAVVAFFCLGAAACATEEVAPDLAPHTETLARARAAFAAKDYAAARAEYLKIPLKSATWNEKLEDAMRSKILLGRYQEAWRLAEIGRRVGAPLAKLGFYSKMAALKSGGCAVSLAASPEPFDLLLNAHAHRFSTRFRTANYRGGPLRLASQHRNQTHLAFAFPHYLGDIAGAQILPSMGCRFERGSFKTPQIAQQNEEEELAAYLAVSESAGASPPLPGHDAVVLRLFSLAAQQKDAALMEALLSRFKGRDAAGWIKIPEPERRFAWQKLIEAKALPPMPLKLENRLNSTVEAIVLAENSPAAAAWLGGTQFDRWPAATKAKIFDHLLAIDGLPARPRILLRKAYLLHEAGDVRGTLGAIRRLAMEQEGEGDDASIDASVRLATAIFREYQFDDSVLGAIQASLPVGRWSQVYRAVLLEQALSGSARAFGRMLERMQKAKGFGSRDLDKQTLAVLAPLATRDLKRFSAAFTRGGRARISQPMLRLLSELAARTAGLAPETRKNLEPYFALVTGFLEEELNRGTSQQAVLGLLNVFDTKRRGGVQKGSATVQQGVTLIGVISLDEEEAMANPYQWDAPANLPLRDLIPYPESAGGRTWVIR